MTTQQRIFIHTLSLPEHTWLNFFREFFDQKSLISDATTGQPLPNRFYIDQGTDPDNRQFDVELAYDFAKSNQNQLPRLVIEDASGAQMMGLTMGQVKSHTFSPSTTKNRADQVRFTYVFHCLSKDRGESQLLASIVSFAMTVFREALLNTRGMIKIEPWSIGVAQPLKLDSSEDIVDTPIQVTFYMIEFWDQIEIGNADAENFAVSFSPLERFRYVHTFMEISDSKRWQYINAFMSLVNPNDLRFVNLDTLIADPLAVEQFVDAAMTTENPLLAESFVRASMRVS